MSVEFFHPNPETFDSHNRQYFSFPFGLVNYICQNPLSGGGLQKLQKTCKYFFAKKKIIVVDENVYNDSNNLIYFANKRYNILNNPKFKYWLNKELDTDGDYSDNLTQFIYRCTLKELYIQGRNISLKQINFFLDGGKIEYLWLKYVDIHYDNGEMVTCDKILEKLPNMQKFVYERPNEIFTSKTFQKMNQIKLNSKLKIFDIFNFNVSNEADLSLLFKFIKKNFAFGSGLIFGFQNHENDCLNKFISILKEEGNLARIKENEIKIVVGVPGANAYYEWEWI